MFKIGGLSMTTQSVLVDEAILVEGAGLSSLLKISIKNGVKLQEIVEVAAKQGGFSPVGAFLFLEDKETPLNLELVIDETYDRTQIHHVHRAKTIEVIVFYEQGDKKRSFSPSNTVGRVLAWAVKAFGIDPEKAPEMKLALHGTETPLDNADHIGRFVPHHHENRLKLDLIRPVVPNGAS